MSAAIRRLEAVLGVRLFDRTSRRVALSDAGEAFLIRARRVMAEVSELRTEMGQYAEGARGVLRVSWSYHTDPQLIAFLLEYRIANPRVQVSIVEWSTADSLAGLRRGDLDLASVALERGSDLTGIEHRVVRAEPYVLVTAPGHRLASARSVRLVDLAGEPFIVTRPDTGLGESFDNAFVAREPPTIAVETDDLASTLALVAQGLGSAVMPQSIAAHGDAGVSLVTLEDAHSFVLAAAWRAGVHSQIVERGIDVLLNDRLAA